MRVPKIDPIIFLVNRKFPDVKLTSGIEADRRLLNGAIFRKNERGELTKISPDSLEAAEIYWLELTNLEKTEIEDLYEEEFSKVCIENDQKKFFNNKQADADFNYWSKMAHWTIDEAIALSFGKDPEVVTSKSLEFTQSYLSPFVHEYRQLSELARRSVLRGTLFNPVYPSIFVKWVRDNEISFPEELSEKVMARMTNYVDWKQKYDDLLVKNNENVDVANDMIAKRDKQISDLGASSQQAKPLHTKEKETLLKLVIGMAVDGYGYSPTASRSPIPKEIAEVLTKLGMPIDTDTVRKWLKDASQILPQDFESP